MTINGTLAQNTVNTLSAETGFSDIDFVVAYENEIKPTPLTKPIAALSVKSCEIGDKLTKTLDTGEIVVTNSRKMNTVLSIDIYLPYSMGGSEGHKIFDRLATYFLFTGSYTVTQIVCGDADYDKDCQAIIVRTKFTFSNTVNS